MKNRCVVLDRDAGEVPKPHVSMSVSSYKKLQEIQSAKLVQGFDPTVCTTVIYMRSLMEESVCSLRSVFDPWHVAVPFLYGLMKHKTSKFHIVFHVLLPLRRVVAFQNIFGVGLCKWAYFS